MTRAVRVHCSALRCWSVSPHAGMLWLRWLHCLDVDTSQRLCRDCGWAKAASGPARDRCERSVQVELRSLGLA